VRRPRLLVVLRQRKVEILDAQIVHVDALQHVLVLVELELVKLVTGDAEPERVLRVAALAGGDCACARSVISAGAAGRHGQSEAGPA
jgi:hypothetical protein